MNKIKTAYYKRHNFIENLLFPLVLICYPLVKINQGIDVADTTYSLANFQYFASMDGTWMVATFLANAVGSLMMHLPFGNTLLGMYFYTALIQSVTALSVYLVFHLVWSDRIPAPLVFLGEFLALGLCWCPSTILYNYLTYLLMTLGILFLYQGILEEKWKYYVAAGVLLGVNVAVRMPNVVQAALIAAVWYGALVCGRTLKQAVLDTLWCILGYAAGFMAPFAAICIRYGAGAYPAMVRTMFAMTDKAVDYKPSAMLTGMFRDYITGSFWLLFAGICMAGGYLLFWVQRKWFAKRSFWKTLWKGIYLTALLILLRFYWGKGVFSFRYYEYGSMYFPAVFFLLTAVLTAFCCIFAPSFSGTGGIRCIQDDKQDSVLEERRHGKDEKIFAVLVLVQILVTPLGSNNDLYPIINNMFLAAPFVLWVVWRKFKTGSTKENGFLVKAPFVLLTALVLVQSAGFHLTFTFQDSADGAARDTKLTAPQKAAGIYTNQENAACLTELAQYAKQAGLAGKPVVLYGEIPGIGYFLDMPPALSTFWPDLDSYRMEEYRRDLEQITELPVIIVSSRTAAYLNGDEVCMEWFGADKEKMDSDEKLKILADYMSQHAFRESFGNGRYVVYMTE